MEPEDRELLLDFRTESREALAEVESLFVELEGIEGEARSERIHRIFRAVHSVKGTAGFFELERIQDLSHAMETLLARVREGELVFHAGLAGALLSALDLLRQLVDALPEVAETPIEAALDTLAAAAKASPATREPAADGATAAAPGSAPRTAREPENESVRVPVRLLDKLMDLAGELVLARNQLLSRSHDTTPIEGRALLQNLDLVTSELQTNIMNTRLQPVGRVFTRFHRVVRDLAPKLAKRARLEVEGAEVELDKSIVELLADPLTHIIRNALDHGIELPEVRSAAGKDPVGTLRLRAYHEAGQVIVEVADDGRGIDAEQMRHVAVKRELLSEQEARLLSDQQALELIFSPGFSSAAEVSSVSGRGVGMDVVQANVTKLGGSIEVETHPGAGTKLLIRLPLTLAIIPSLIVSLGADRFAVPQANLVELVRIGDGEAATRIEEISGFEVLRRRGHLLPLVRLAEVLGLVDEPGAPGAEQHALVLRVGDSLYGLVVDEVHDGEEIVVKSLSRLLRQCKTFAGATIMGDGRVAMILDVLGIAAKASLSLRNDALAERQPVEAGAGERRSLVLFRNAAEEQFALDLRDVVRLEKISAAEIDRIGGAEFIRYRGRGLPLLRLERVLPVGPLASDEAELHVIIPRVGRSVGILVGEIVDAVETQVIAERDPEDAEAVTGRAILGGHVTWLLDAEHLVAADAGRPA